MLQYDDGYYVLHSDYAAKEAECERLRKALESIRDFDYTASGNPCDEMVGLAADALKPTHQEPKP